MAPCGASSGGGRGLGGTPGYDVLDGVVDGLEVERGIDVRVADDDPAATITAATEDAMRAADADVGETMRCRELPNTAYSSSATTKV